MSKKPLVTPIREPRCDTTGRAGAWTVIRPTSFPPSSPVPLDPPDTPAFRAIPSARVARNAGSVARTSSLQVVIVECPRFALGPAVARSIRADLARSQRRSLPRDIEQTRGAQRERFRVGRNLARTQLPACSKVPLAATAIGRSSSMGKPPTWAITTRRRRCLTGIRHGGSTMHTPVSAEHRPASPPILPVGRTARDPCSSTYCRALRRRAD